MSTEHRLVSKGQRWLMALALGVVVLGGVIAAQLGAAGSAQTFQNVSVEDLAAASGHLVDVREPWEYARGHVPGAQLIPLGELEARASELPENMPIYLICQTGNRSLRASDILLAAGVKDVRNVLGGTQAWTEAGYPVERNE